jgi:lysophospholipase L1-like esterase
MKYFITLFFLIISSRAMGQIDQTNADWANLKRYASENKSLPPPSPDERRIVFMGNSITEFWKMTDSAFFANNSFINRGISGQTTPQMLIRFRPDVIALRPTVVVILAGINDIAENTGPIPLEDVFGNIVSMAQLAQSNGIRVVLSSVLPALDFPWRQGLRPAEKIIRLNTMIKTYCHGNGLVYLDYYSSMVDEKKGLDRKFAEDGVHPNLAGYRVMEPLLLEAVDRAMHSNR